MKYRTRTYYTSSQKALMWERWKEGWTLHQIAHLFNRAHTSVRGILARTGGFRPSQRIRSAKALTLPSAKRSHAHWRMVGHCVDRLEARASTINDQPRTGPQRWTGGLSRYPGRRCRMGPRASFQAVQTGREPGPGQDRVGQASAAVIAGADRRMAQAYLSMRREPARVTRDPLPQPLHSSARRPEEGVAAAFETNTRHAPVSTPHAEDRYPRPDC